MRRSLIGGSLALALGISLTALPALAAVGSIARPAVAATTPVTAVTLDWGIKESFRSYVEGPIGQGEITVVDPATRNADGTFRFVGAAGGAGSLDPDARTAALDLAGGVEFDGHAGALYVRFADPRIRIDGDAGVLVLDVDVLESGEVVTYDDVALADLDLTGADLTPDPDGVVTVTGVAATLTKDGAPAFAGFYQAGAALDAVSFAATLGGTDPTETPTQTPTDTPTQTPTHTPTETPTETPTQSPTASPTTSPTSPPYADPTAPAYGAGQVSSGVLTWGVHGPFRAYVSGSIARGEWIVSGVTDSAGVFSWRASSGQYDVAGHAGSVRFGGSVRFTGHAGALDLTLARPQVRFAGANTATLYLDVTTKSMSTGAVTVRSAVPFATLNLAAGRATLGTDTIAYAGVPAVLTNAGADAFGGFYTAGTTLDPVTVRFAVGGATVPGGGQLAATGTSPTLAIAGLVFLTIGVGLLVARRRLLTSAA